jgi:hypothetical protein
MNRENEPDYDLVMLEREVDWEVIKAESKLPIPGRTARHFMLRPRSGLAELVLLNENDRILVNRRQKAADAKLKTQSEGNAAWKRLDDPQGSKVHLRMERKQALR